MHRLVSALIISALLGCKAETFGAEDAPSFADDPIVSTPSAQWAGGSLELASSAFVRHRGDTALITIGGRDLLATRADSDHFNLLIPFDLQTGNYTLVVTLAGDSGATHARVVGSNPPLVLPEANLGSRGPEPWPWDHPAGVLTSDLEGVPLFIDATTGRVTRVPGFSGQNFFGPGTSYRAGIATGFTTDTRVPMIVAVDPLSGRSLPTADTVSYDHNFYDWQFFEIGPGRFVATGKYWATVWSAGTPGTFLDLDRPSQFIMSPDRRFGTFVTLRAADPSGLLNLPLIDLGTATVARELAGIGSTDGVAWSPNGASLYLLARPYWEGPQRVVRIDPSTGVEVATVDVEGRSTALAVDAIRGWLFELAEIDGRFILRIRDPETLAPIAQLESASPAAACFDIEGPTQVIVPDPTRSVVRVIALGCDATTILRFDLLN